MRRFLIFNLSVLLLLEIGARLFLPVPPLPDTIALERVENPVRLFPPYTAITYDIQGLYFGSENATVETDGRGLLEPIAQGPQILFLGGSTTEARYVEARTRFSALLGGDNAAYSGANILDMTANWEYLVSTGYHADMVILATMHNDRAWFNRLAQDGYTFTAEDYAAGQLAYYQRTLQEPSGWQRWQYTMRLFGWLRFLNPANPRVVEAYRAETLRPTPPVVNLDNCDDPQAWNDFQAVETLNMQRLAAQVEANGAQLVIMSEATSYGAPGESFRIDLRLALPCGEGVLSHTDAVRWYARLDSVYLQAAQDVGLDTIDLASLMGQFTNSASGGVYQYDSMHYTAAGSQQVARILRPILEGLIE